MATTTSGITVSPTHPTIGAEIGGIDLRQPLSDDRYAEIRALMIKHKALFFRDQDIDSNQFFAFATRFGEPEMHQYFQSKKAPTMTVLHADRQTPPKGTNCWHTDWSGTEHPTMAIVLHALEVPEAGGDTLFADMGAAYRGLPEGIRRDIDKLTAVHDTRPYLADHLDVNSPGFNTEYLIPREQPVVRTHPESGEKILYVNKLFTQSINGLPEQEGKALLDYLCAQVLVPEYQVRFRWRRHSVVLFDNRSTQHYACADYWPAVRRIERVTLVGDRPF